MVNELLHARAYSLQCIRQFFISKGYLEVETPLLSAALIPEACLEVFKTVYLPPDSTRAAPEDYYLIPSPEVWMKRLLAGGSGSIFQLTKCFRNVESKGKYHSPEFTMLEWYSVDHNYLDEMLITEELLAYLADRLKLRFGQTGFGTYHEPGTSFSNSPAGSTACIPPCERISIQEACQRWAHIDLAACQEHDRFYQAARDLDLAVNSDDTWEEIFNKLFLTLVEPELPVARPVILYDYPAQVPTLARQKGFYAERWELYIKGVEIANCFTEETEREKVAGFIASEHIRKTTRCRVQHRPDTELSAFFSPAFPACSGVALGIDRLLMVLLNLKSIRDIMLSSFTGD